MKIRANLKGVQPEILVTIPIVFEIFAAHGLVCVLTSCVRDKGAGSLHPLGFAADFGATRDVNPVVWQTIEREARDALGSEFDVLAHDSGSGMHLHVEFDPR